MVGLAVSFVDSSFELDPGESLTFGRAADLVIDESNLHLHRRVGRFSHAGDLWWIENIGRSIRLTVLGDDGTGMEVLPSSRCPLWFGPCRIRFVAGKATYEIECLTPGTSSETIDLTDDMSPIGTVDLGSLPLTVDQRRLVACLAERHLIDPSLRHSIGWELPSNQQVALRLGWSITTYNRKLDRLCARFAQKGIAGVRGNGVRATDRRARLVEHALTSRMVTSDDLSLVDLRNDSVS